MRAMRRGHRLMVDVRVERLGAPAEPPFADGLTPFEEKMIDHEPTGRRRKLI